MVVNLASNEYSRAVDRTVLDGAWVTPRFLDRGTSGEYRMVSFFAKYARGLMARHLVQTRARTRKAIRDFDLAGYRFDPGRSTSAEPVFLRDERQRA